MSDNIASLLFASDFFNFGGADLTAGGGGGIPDSFGGGGIVISRWFLTN